MPFLNEKLHIKVETDKLRAGMFVAGLDRPWEGTPFLLQGFLINTEEELTQLRGLCRIVYVDPTRSSVEMKALDSAAGPLLPHRRSSAPTPAKKTNRIRRGPPPDLKGLSEPEAFRESLPCAVRTQTQAHRYLNRAFNDVRLGSSIDTDEAKQAVSSLIDSITTNVNAALWLTNLKKRDEYTSIHCLNVCVLSIAFARHLGYGEEELKIIGLGALLHDLGKIKTPPEILNKPARLTSDEFEVMRKHPVDGYEMLCDGGGVPPQSLQIIRHHHERIAGNGYPDGWQGDQIPLPVLVTSVVDVYDAITSDRCYHDGVPAHQGLQLLYDIAPNNFGRELIEEFIRCIGIYPVGSLVELTTGALGVVLSADPLHRLKPLVRLVREPDGSPCADGELIDLAELSGHDNESWRRWGIRRVLSPADYGIDVKSIVAKDNDVSSLIN
ncbi:MAG: HD-GYP domain-containing protein [Acidihalobacter sp.]|uniref:HD-GYP domain-containing protein n=1 Tax=Acidihalobacter sp. TaxID=1872108 RepID=UPI00307D6C3E